ncbi:PAS domain-containing protein [Sphingobacterium hotanense]|uniref:PAS domain-containing protein n=1 Tax=Sphingobacterium hotanense TaxID=649196 RepID=UPI0011F3B1E6|nr:PAS domain-containing protein [Sphingobacterium hotanense]
MKTPILTDIYRNWEEIGRFKSREELQLDLELYKKLLDIVRVGDSDHFLFDPFLRKIVMTSVMFGNVVVLRPEELDVDYLMNNIHPECLPVLGDFEATVAEFKKSLPNDKLTKYKSRYNYRFRTKRGEYVHILQQSNTVLADEDGAVLRNLVIHTDILEIAPFQRMKLSFIDLEGEHRS